ncbi:MAG: response regulator transcription factor [Deltaproteobacteria bacterium]|nr:response regulator transcription factor [Candidatus Tharpella aukensis]
MVKAAEKWLIYILGPRKMQNELLATFLHSETGIISHIENSDKFYCPSVIWPGKIMFFCDCQMKPYSELLDQVAAAKFLEHQNFYPLLFNVEEKISTGEDLVGFGVRGLFYKDEPLETLVLGVAAVRKGEIWLPRHILSSYLSSFHRREKIQKNAELKESENRKSELKLLSVREREVLQLVVKGHINDEIAAKLGLSPHTVRSHLHRIFRKIEVKSRYQAAVWASKNF